LASALRKAGIRPFDTSKICEKASTINIYSALPETPKNQPTATETVNLNKSAVETNKDNTPPVNDNPQYLKVQTVQEKPKRKKFTKPSKVLANLASESNQIHLKIQHDNRADKVEKAKHLPPPKKKTTSPQQQQKKLLLLHHHLLLDPLGALTIPSYSQLSHILYKMEAQKKRMRNLALCVATFFHPSCVRISILVILNLAQCDICMKWVDLAL